MFRVFDPLQLAFERLWNHRVLVVWALVGLTAATTLALSLPLYVDSVDSRLLASRLRDPPYAFRFRYLGSWKGNIRSDDVKSATAQIDTGFISTMGLPVVKIINYTRGGAWSTKLGNGKTLGPFSIGSLQGADAQIRITQGKWPADPTKPGDPIPMVLPVAGLVLYFVAMVAGLLVRRQQTEDVTLRSRGMSRRGIIAIHFLMWLILATAAFGIGLLLAPLAVQLVGKTTSFLRFDNTDPPLAVTFTPQAILAGIVTALI